MILDPNTVLTELREVALRVLANGDDWSPDDLVTLVDRWNALDEWITRGGFLPDLWVEAQRRALENTRVTPSVQTSDVSRSDASRSDGQTSDVSEAGSIEELSTLIDGDPWRA